MVGELAERLLLFGYQGDSHPLSQAKHHIETPYPPATCFLRETLACGDIIDTEDADSHNKNVIQKIDLARTQTNKRCYGNEMTSEEIHLDTW